jgi:D-3-phosphoglycerate dehydrogenase / 2-oxoglutarate reductase
MAKAAVSDHTFESLKLQRDVLSSAGFELEEIQPKCITEDDVIQRCQGATVLLVQWAPITRRVLEGIPGLKAVIRYGIGVNNIDLDAARDLGVAVANVPTYCLEEVSNHAVSMLLSLGRRIPQDHDSIRQGGWGIGPLMPIPAFVDLTLGLVGFGAIARRVAKKAQVFGFNLVAYDPYLNDSVFSDANVGRVDLDTLLRTADIISLHTPLVAETKHLVRKETVDRMKRGVIIINTSRGGVIREPDLIEALSDGRVLAAGLDVFEEEPPQKDNPLRSMSNVLLTSHAASVSTRAVEALQIKAAEAARDFLCGKRPEGAIVWPGPSK